MPTFLRRLRARIKYWNHERDLAREIDAHRAMAEADLATTSSSPQHARWAAARLLGNTTIAREDSRTMWIPRFFQQVAQDGRYAFRGMRRSPAFTTAAIIMLTIGIGLVAGGYTVFNGLFVRGWTLPESQRVFAAYAQRTEQPASGSVLDGFSFGAAQNAIAAGKSADFVAMKIDYFRVRVRRDERGAHTAGVLASDNLVDALRVPMQFGHSTISGVENAVVISHRLWQQVFQGDPGITGRAAWLGDLPVVIAGVTAETFDGLGPTRLDVIVPFSLGPKLGRNSSGAVVIEPTSCCVMIAGRLRDGYGRGQAAGELNLLTSVYRQQTHQPGLTVRVSSTAPFDGFRGSSRGRSAALVFALVGVGLLLVFVLTCANVGNLYLARSLQRRREIAVRLALGAGRARVIRQLLTEGFVLAAAAGIAAFAMTLAVPAVMQAIEDNFTSSMLASDWRVGLVAAITVVVASLVVSLAPAFQATRLAGRLSGSPVPGRGRGLILGVQIAIAAVLVLSATLITRGIIHAAMAPTDFALHTTSLAAIETRSGKTPPTEKLQSIRNHLAAATATSHGRIGMLDVRTRSGRIGVADSFVSRRGSDVRFNAQLAPISPEAMSVLGVPLLAGRWPSTDPQVRQATVNETLARRLWPRQNPIGQLLTVDYFRGDAYEVVGIVRDAHFAGFGDVEATVVVAPAHPLGLPSLVARSEPGVDKQLAALVTGIDSDLVVSIEPLRSMMTQTLKNAQIGATVAGALGLAALLLAIIGVFGVFSYLVEERRREIGIRLALGATRKQVRRALFDASRGAILGGLASGLVLSAIAGVALRSYLFGLSPADPISYAAVSLVLVLAAALATLIPVRRALRVDPAVTLRAD